MTATGSVPSSSSVVSSQQSPRPGTAATSRRSYHSAIPPATPASVTSSHLSESVDEDRSGDETPRRVLVPNPRLRDANTGVMRNTRIGSESEETGSQTASSDEDGDAGHAQPRTTGAQLQQPSIGPRRFTNPSPYQHPAQYPAPVSSQLPINLPPALPSSQSIRSIAPPRSPRSGRLSQVLESAQQRRQETPLGMTASQPLPGRYGAVGGTSPTDRALDNIQTSLAALHERLNTLETTNALLSRQLSSARSGSPISQLFSRLLALLHIRPSSPSATSTSFTTLLLRSILSLFSSLRNISHDAVALVFLVAAVASLRRSRGNLREMVRQWIRILIVASGAAGLINGGVFGDVGRGFLE